MFVFGSGVLIGTPSGANPTPINFGLIQSADVTIKTTTKKLYGQNNFPVAIGSGQRDLTVKAKLARLSGHALASLYFGGAPASGSTPTVYGESHNVPATTPFTITVTNSATFATDLGVVYAATGLPLKNVASAPTLGQYSVAAGVYTFAAADEGAGVLISYSWTNSATTTQSIAVASQLIGPTVNFGATLYAADPTTGNPFSLTLYNCVATNLSFGTKIEDFVMPDFEFEAYANAAGQVCQLNFGDAA